MKFRTFAYEDARFCYAIRKRAFTELFVNELSAAEIAACVDAYSLYDYLRMQKAGEFFVAEENDTPRGFFTLKRLTRKKAMIPMIYLDPDHCGRGLGRKCMHWLEQWVATNWSEVTHLLADTVIPQSNGGFYRAVGFSATGETVCHFPGLDIKATRFAKYIQ